MKTTAVLALSFLIVVGSITSSAYGQVTKTKMSPIGAKSKSMPSVLDARNAETSQLLPSKRNQFAQKWPKPVGSRAPSSDRLLVVFDAWGSGAFMGTLYGKQMTDLLSHYGYGIDAVSTQDYTAGMIDSHRATVYVGAQYDTDLPAAFKTDVMATTKPICWTGYNLWRLAWLPDYTGYNPTFEARFGFRFLYMDDQFSSVTYKGVSLSKSVPAAARTQVLNNANKATVLATTKTTAGASMPYMLRSKNFYFVADNPISGVRYADISNHDRTLAFCDIMHDVIGTNAPTSRLAIVRIEDVSAQSDPAALRKIADILAAEKVPFVVSTIPLYRDPLGYWDHGFGLEVPFEQTLANSPDVVAALNYMVSKGGQIIMHGTTHQYNDVPNYNSGVSGDDWEFFRLVKNDAGGVDAFGPVYEDSSAWAADRLALGKSYLAQAGFDATGWLTPHYLASPADYVEFGKAFKYSLDPTVNFVLDPNGYLYHEQLFAPFPTKDGYGRVVLPETVGFISPYAAGASPTDIVTRAKKLKVVRDGWVGMFFHPFLDPLQLKAAVSGVKRQGFTFVSPNASFGPK